MIISNVRKNSEGVIEQIKLDDGSIMNIEQAIECARSGQIEHVLVGHSKSGKAYLRSEPDSTQNNNLDNLPIF